MTRLASRLAVTTSLAVIAALAVGCGTAAEDPKSAEAAETKSAPEKTWTVIEVGGDRIGYGHVTSREVERDGRTLVQTEDWTQMVTKRFGQTITMQVELRTLATPDGDLVEMWSSTWNPPAKPTRTHAVVEGTKLVLETETAGKSSKQTLDWEAGTKSPHYDWELATRPMKKGEKRTAKVFLPELNRVDEATIEAAGEAKVATYDGTARKLARIVQTSGVIPGTTTFFVDERGRELVTWIELFGTKMVQHVVPEEVALEKIEGGELDLAVETLIEVAPIPHAHRTKRAVYRIHAEGEDPARWFAEGATQSIRRIDDETIEVTVVAASFQKKPTYAKAQRRYLDASQYLQSNDERVVAHAKKATGEATKPAAVATAMEKYVRRELKTKNFSTALASAAEVAERLEGDCTEHAVLLAAMLRAGGIPSRIAVGFVYAESQKAFAGHMWTEAFVDGAWVPLDGTLGRGGTAAAHLKLADSAFDDDAGHPITAFLPVLESVGRLEIEVVEVE